MTDGTANTSAGLLAASVALPHARLAGRRGRRCVAHRDQDAVTLAAEAVIGLLGQVEASPRALLFATTTPPYEEGGSAQPLVELAGLGSDLFVCDLNSTVRDGLAALRLAVTLAASGTGPVVVVASHVRRDSGDADSGDGAVALLIGTGDGLARLTPGPAYVEELRDRWRLPGEQEPREADASFLATAGPSRLAGLVAGEDPGVPVAVFAPQPRFATKAERDLGGAGDRAAADTGQLGAAHPLLRLLLGLREPGSVVATTGGLAELLRHEPTGDVESLVAGIETAVTAGEDVAEEPPRPEVVGTDIWSSAPRAWRERGQDLRLEGIEMDGRVVYPPPPGAAAAGKPVPLRREGTVLTCTTDRVYPLAEATGMAMVDLDDGTRFYCQVAEGEEIEIGQRVQLVPRRMHTGGGVAQYFWKAVPCR